jgi:hypothetical protein
MRLLWYIRDILGFTGTKFGCGVESGFASYRSPKRILEKAVDPSSQE